jgi:hypothetical protein
MSISPFETFHFALTVVSCHSITGTHVVPSTGISRQSHPFSPRERAGQSLQTYAASQGSCSYMLESAISANKSLQKNILTRFFLPDSHKMYMFKKHKGRGKPIMPELHEGKDHGV